MDWRTIDQAPHNEPILCTSEELLSQGYIFVCKWAQKSEEHWQDGFYTLTDKGIVLFDKPTLFQYLH